ncbi:MULTISPECIES: spore maturation protein [Geomicrobium]|uniref:Spore maturation protein B n=1 Tax=Geomicrobium sediminis TaxID=1347788 RepID=A0ABS2PDT6_9BACL|nr:MULTISPECIES: spore maturation protein [Geomicrobium]MBM7633577.1 spore maturation protein B [Geomicrobium sediminis]GAK06606.1 spore maturation protein B [Geomicrobium sp. JCM 19038]
MVILSTVSMYLIPVLLFVILATAIYKKVPAYETFVDGAKDGFQLAIGIIPPLVAMLVAISIFRASGALDFILAGIAPLLAMVGVPPDIVPLAIMRPLSGTGALGIMSDLIAVHGPDSLIGRMASTMQGSTDTTLYVITVYFGAVGIKKIGDALKVGLLADVCGLLAAIFFVVLVFGSM